MITNTTISLSLLSIMDLLALLVRSEAEDAELAVVARPPLVVEVEEHLYMYVYIYIEREREI